MTNGEKFLIIYNNLEQFLKRKLNLDEHMPFQQLIKYGSETFKELHYFRHDLIEYGQLRNAIVHNRNGDKLIAEPYEETVLNFEAIFKKISEPKRVLEVINNEVLTLSPKDTLQYALKLMGKYDYTAIPVYEKDIFKGAFNSSSITHWLILNMKENEIIEYKDVRVEDLLIYKGEINAIKFVSQNTTVYDIRDIYKKNITAQIQIDAIVITENGNPNEQPLGIITNWDMPKILENL